MVFGSSNSDIDLMDNPYFNVNVYKVGNTNERTISDSIKLQKCNKNDLKKFIEKEDLQFYENSICFADMSDFYLTKNTYDTESLQISLDPNVCEEEYIDIK